MLKKALGLVVPQYLSQSTVYSPSPKNEFRKLEVSIDKWAKWVIEQDVHAVVHFGGGKSLGSNSMDRWRRYSDATTIKDALQAGCTQSDMRKDFEKKPHGYREFPNA